MDLPARAVDLLTHAVDLPSATAAPAFERAGPTEAAVVHGKLLTQRRFAATDKRLRRDAAVGHHHR